MYNLLLIPSFAEAYQREAAIDTIATAAAALPGLQGALVAPTLPGVYNGGDLICRLSFAEEAARDAASATMTRLFDDSAGLEQVRYAGGRIGGTSTGRGLYRVALFCANVRPDADRLAAFANDTATMPRHVRTIRRWQLATASAAQGTRPWTHVWEQEYDDLAGLNGSYMMHPVHWAHVERWFDPEYPEHLVDPVLVHSFCLFDRPVILG